MTNHTADGLPALAFQNRSFYIPTGRNLCEKIYFVWLYIAAGRLLDKNGWKGIRKVLPDKGRAKKHAPSVSTFLQCTAAARLFIVEKSIFPQQMYISGKREKLPFWKKVRRFVWWCVSSALSGAFRKAFASDVSQEQMECLCTNICSWRYIRSNLWGRAEPALRCIITQTCGTFWQS